MRYLTKQTFKDILKESGLSKEGVKDLKSTILNTIKGLGTLMDDTNETYINNYTLSPFTNRMRLRTIDDLDSIIYILMEIGFKEEEIKVDEFVEYVDIYVYEGRVDHIKRLISYGIMGKVIPKCLQDNDKTNSTRG